MTALALDLLDIALGAVTFVRFALFVMWLAARKMD